MAVDGDGELTFLSVATVKIGCVVVVLNWQNWWAVQPFLNVMPQANEPFEHRLTPCHAH